MNQRVNGIVNWINKYACVIGLKGMYRNGTIKNELEVAMGKL
jgi:hypothetical protein